MSNLSNNTAQLQALLQELQTKMTGTTLPSLSNEGIASDLLAGKELIDSAGNVIVGTLSLDSELTEQTRLIEELRTALSSKAAGGGEIEISLQEKSVTPTEDTQDVSADSGYDGLSKVTVNPIPSNYIVPSGTLDITENGTKDVTNYKNVNVNVPPEDLTEVLSEQESLLDELSTAISNKESGSGGDVSDNIELQVLTREVTSYSNSTLTTLGMYAFYGCTKLTSLDLPALATANTYAFMECTKLTEVTFPSLTKVSSSMFRRCLGLVKADFHNITSIADYSFYQCTHLETLIIRSNSVCTLANTSTALNSTLIAKATTGYVYVPRDLVSTYQSATNWSTYADRFRAIEDYPEICG